MLRAEKTLILTISSLFKEYGLGFDGDFFVVFGLAKAENQVEDFWQKDEADGVADTFVERFGEAIGRIDAEEDRNKDGSDESNDTKGVAGGNSSGITASGNGTSESRKKCENE